MAKRSAAEAGSRCVLDSVNPNGTKCCTPTSVPAAQTRGSLDLAHVKVGATLSESFFYREHVAGKLPSP